MAAAALTMALAGAARADIAAYNDCRPATPSGDPANNTTIGARQSGPLKDSATGASLGAAIAIVNNGANTTGSNRPPEPPAPRQPPGPAPLNHRPTVTVSDPNGDPLQVVFYGRALTNAPPGPDFTLAVLPDTQCYTLPRNGGSLDMFTAQAEWIVTNAGPPVAYVAGLGDITDDGLDASYRNATNAVYRLEDPVRTGRPDGIPYGLTLGNHDEMNGGGTTYNAYFGTNRFRGRAYWGGSYGANNNTHYDLFRAGGLDFLSICLEYNDGATPAAAVWIWVTNVVQTYSGRRAFVVQHDALSPAAQPTPAPWTAEGLTTYNALKGFPNFFAIFCGHNHGNGRRADTNNGTVVYSLLSDYQDEVNGGNGLLRTYTFSPSNNTIRAQTFSPYAGTAQAGADWDYTLPYSMTAPPPPFSCLGTNAGVASGAQTSVVWPGGLAPGVTYEWYATASDGQRLSVGSNSRFTTVASGAGALPEVETRDPAAVRPTTADVAGRLVASGAGSPMMARRCRSSTSVLITAPASTVSHSGNDTGAVLTTVTRDLMGCSLRGTAY
jgi:hypothetical protein